MQDSGAAGWHAVADEIVAMTHEPLSTTALELNEAPTRTRSSFAACGPDCIPFERGRRHDEVG
jgi:hypothetical protein